LPRVGGESISLNGVRVERSHRGGRGGSGEDPLG